MKKLFVLIMLAGCATAPTEPKYDIAPQVASAKSLMARADVDRAMTFIENDRETILREWRELTEIPAPSGNEAARADYIVAHARELGYEAERDGGGNVIVTRKGTGSGKRVVFDAHMDTVFAQATNVKTRVENGHLFAPGVGDNTRNVVALLAMMRAMNAANVATKGDVIFLFTTEEETTFKGVKAFIEANGKKVDRFVALDGGFQGFTYAGIGIYWDRYHFIGPGGHTRSNARIKSATLPVARSITRMDGLRIPRNAWLNVGMLGGSDVFNAKASDAWMSVDLRSSDPETLHRLDREVESIVKREAERAGMQMKREEVSKSEPAVIQGHRTSDMVLTAEGVWRAFGFDPPISDSASNHSSVALLAGIPAISTGVAPCRGSHGLEENCEIEPIYIGIRRNLLLAVALTE